MRLVVPYLDQIDPVDRRLIRLAEFLGIDCLTIPLDKSAGAAPEFLERTIALREACFVVNPCVLQGWLGGDTLPAALGSFLVTHFPHLLIHSPRLEAFDSSVINVLSCGHLQAAWKIGQSERFYDISPESRDICGPFAGLCFEPTNHVNDQVFSIGHEGPELLKLISIAGQPFMAALQQDRSKIWFVAGRDVADLDAEIGDAPVAEFFSRFLPHAMALRYIFGQENWRPLKQYASVIIDDPLLRRNYGFLNFESLLALMKQRNFHSTIAFIPHNFRRSSPGITRMFRHNTERFSLCFHGNDHTGAEFASNDAVLLNTLLRIAEQRMERHSEITGLHCDRAMVFPQGNFSLEAMAVLRAHNFDGAVNTVPHPMHDSVRLTLRDIAQPAVLRYEDFPLFLRKDSVHTQSADIAFNCFFGRPVLIVEHHEVFQHPETLADAATRINTVAPDICWSNIGATLRNSVLEKRTPDGVHHIRAYSNTVQVSNQSSSLKQFSIEWNRRVHPEQVLQDGIESVKFTADRTGMHVASALPGGSSRTFSLVHQNPYREFGDLGLRRKTKAYVRRRLSEVRDNYLSKNPRVLAAAEKLQRSLPH
jgi:hypothetical protein